MAKLSSQFASISPGMDTDTAQEGLVSIMKAWRIDPDEVKSEIMDPINTLGNSFAESNQDIVEGMERSAAALAATGTTYKDAFALFTGAQEVLQNSEVAGRALRSISMRVHGYSENSEDGLMETDNELKNVTGDLINLTKTAEHSQGVSIFKPGSTTEFKSLVDYFGEIHDIWDEMDQKQQNDFLQKAFGKTQAQAGSAIIKNYDAIKDSLKAIEGVDKYGHNISLTSDEFTEYKNLTKEIAETFPSMVSGYNEQNEAIIKNKGSIEALTKAYEDNQKAYYNDILSKSGDTFNDFKTVSKDELSKKNQLSDLMNNKYSQEQMTGLLENYSSFESVFGKTLGKSLTKELFSALNDEFRHEATLLSGRYFDTIDFTQLSPQLQEKVHSVFSELNQTIDTEADKVGDVDSEGNVSGNKKINAVKDKFKKIKGSDKFIEGLKEDELTLLYRLEPDKVKSLNSVKDMKKQLQSEVDAEEDKAAAEKEAERKRAYQDTVNRFTTNDSKKGDGKAIKDFLKSENIDSQLELEYFNKVTKNAKSAAEAIELYNQAKKNGQSAQDYAKDQSFKTAWSDLGSSDDEALQSTQEDLTALAKAGKLTKEAFHGTSGADKWAKSFKDKWL